MARRTLNTVWQNFERIHSSFERGKSDPEKAYGDIEALLEKDDVAKITNQLGEILCVEYENFEDVVLSFISPRSDENMRATSYNKKEKELYVNPFKVFEFHKYSKDLFDDIDGKMGGGSFDAYRKEAFVAQMSKLPTKCVLFLLVLQQIAVSEGITHIGLTEDPGIDHDDTAYYQTLNWAFNELEKKIHTLNGINLRTDYNITWHESEWFNP